jgi:hypothetical protein
MGMAYLKRGHAKGVVLLGVFLTADTEEPDIEQPDCCGQHPALGESRPSEISDNRLAQLGQGATEVEHPIEFLLVALEPPTIVIPILAPARSIRPHGLDVAVLPWADPHLVPRRGYRQCLDASEALGVDDLLSVG